MASSMSSICTLPERPPIRCVLSKSINRLCIGTLKNRCQLYIIDIYESPELAGKLRLLRCPHWSGLRHRPFAGSWVIFPILVVSCNSLVFLYLLGRAQFESEIGRNFGNQAAS